MSSRKSKRVVGLLVALACVALVGGLMLVVLARRGVTPAPSPSGTAPPAFSTSPPASSSGVPVSIQLTPVDGAHQSKGTIEFTGPFPVGYTVLFCAPPGHEDVCPAPITGTAQSESVPLTVTLASAPDPSKRFVIDVVVLVTSGAGQGTCLRDGAGLVVNPNATTDEGRGQCSQSCPSDGN